MFFGSHTADTHYTLLHNREAIVAFLNKELELS